jgi:hypothetical protein
MHDGALALFSRSVRDVLNNTYLDRWVGRPPRSTDLNPLDFYLWGHLNTLVYAAPVGNEETLHRCIVDACQTILNSPSIVERMLRSVVRRVEASIESHGGLYDHLLVSVLFRL